MQYDKIGVHMTHCNQGEYEDTCKYGDDEECPALLKKKEEQAGKIGVQVAAEEYSNYNVFELNGNLFSNNNDEAGNAIKCSIESYIAGWEAAHNQPDIYVGPRGKDDHPVGYITVDEYINYGVQEWVEGRDSEIKKGVWTDEDMINMMMPGIPEHLRQTTYKDVYDSKIRFLEQYKKQKNGNKK